MVSLFPLILFIFEAGSYLFIFTSALLRYYRLRYKPDLYMGAGFVLALLSGVTRFYSSLTNNPELAELLFKILNGLFLMPAIFMWFVGFTLYHKGDFEFLVVFVSYITGILGGAFVFSNNVYVTFDEVTQNWNGVYPSSFFVLIIPLIVFAIYRIIQPIIRRAKYTSNRRDKITLAGMAFGIILVVFWGFSSLLTEVNVIRQFRPLFLSIGWLIWYFSSQRNPFFLGVSEVNPKRIMITNDQGHLYFQYQFQENKADTKSELIAPLVQAINNMAREVLESDSGIKSYDVGDNKVVTIAIDSYYFHLISQGIDNAMVALFNYFARNSLAEVKNAQSMEYIDISHQVRENFEKLVILSPS